MILRLPFLGKWRKQLFVHFDVDFVYTQHYIFGEVCHQISLLAYFSSYFIKACRFSSSINCPSLIPCWLLTIYLVDFSEILKGFPSDSWNVLSTSEIFLLGWQFLVLFSRCFSSCSLYLLFTMLIMTIYKISDVIDLALNIFKFLFLLCFNHFSLEYFKFLCIGICWISLINSGCFFMLSCFYCNHLWLNFTFGSWFGWYTLDCCFYVGRNKVFIYVIFWSMVCLSKVSRKVSNLFLKVTVY